MVKIRLGALRFVLVSVILLIAIAILFSIFALSGRQQQSEPVVSNPVFVPHSSELYTPKELSNEELTVELAYWLKIQETQPTHRDVLINISHLYRALGEESQAIYYWEQARKTDPNHILFK